jgi:Icc protein
LQIRNPQSQIRNGKLALPVRILQFSDFHLTGDPHERVKGVPTHDALQDVVRHIAQSGQRFDRVIVTGDIAQNGEMSAYRAAMRILGTACAPTHVVPGNHDDRAVFRNAFRDIVPHGNGPIGFCTRAGQWRLIGLDTLVPGQGAGRIADDQLQWLAAELAAEPNLLTAVFMHHHPMPVRCEWLDAIGLQDPLPFLQLVAQSPQVRIVCAGHVHLESRFKLNSASIFTAPSTCVQFDGRSDNRPVLEHIPPGYRILELHDDRFETEVVRLPELRYPPQAD